MTIKSMPPISSHLAEMPVPAPPPMIGLPASIFFLKRSRICSLVNATSKPASSSSQLRAALRFFHQFEEHLDGPLREGGVVDVRVDLLDADARLHVRLDRVEHRPVRFGPPERLPFAV